jgi:hypothetical protein
MEVLSITEIIDLAATPTQARVEAWEFILGGGSAYNNFSFDCPPSNPSGNTPDTKGMISFVSLEGTRPVAIGRNSK